MKNVKIISVIACLVLLSFVFAGCNVTPVTPTVAKVTIAGSTSVLPLAQDLQAAYASISPNVKIDIQGGGSAAGIKAVQENTADIGTSSRELTDTEKAGLTTTIIAYDGIAVIVNPKNTVADLSADQITKIFKGEITNWKDVGGADKNIKVIVREDASGTRTAFDEMLKITETKDGKTITHLSKDAQVAVENGGVIQNIASTENAIGYCSAGMIDSTIKAVKIGGVEPSLENIKSKAYAIQRPFIMLTKGTVKPEVKAFIDYILSDGQTVVAKKYIPVK